MCKEDIFAYKQVELLNCLKHTAGNRGRTGLPLGLNMYEQLPIWAGFFESLGFEVLLSAKPSYYPQGRYFFDTACYPARLMQCHIESLLDTGADFIFLPCERFNIDGHCSDNPNACPFTAYYPELLRVENARLTANNFISPYLDLGSKKNTVAKLYETFKNFGLKKREIANALDVGFDRLQNYRRLVHSKTETILVNAQREGRQIAVIAGRPYHLDWEISRGINELLTSLGITVLSMDGIFPFDEQYNIKLYRTADFVCKNKNTCLIQLISHGCEFDSITSGEVCAILESNGKPYTKIILDETTNPEAIKLQISNLFAAIK